MTGDINQNIVFGHFNLIENFLSSLQPLVKGDINQVQNYQQNPNSSEVETIFHNDPNGDIYLKQRLNERYKINNPLIQTGIILKAPQEPHWLIKPITVEEYKILTDQGLTNSQQNPNLNKFSAPNQRDLFKKYYDQFTADQKAKGRSALNAIEKETLRAIAIQYAQWDLIDQGLYFNPDPFQDSIKQIKQMLIKPEIPGIVKMVSESEKMILFNLSQISFDFNQPFLRGSSIEEDHDGTITYQKIINLSTWNYVFEIFMEDIHASARKILRLTDKNKQ